MMYPTPPYGVVKPIAVTSTKKIIAVVVCVVITIIIILGAIGIALGVGLGIGLSKSNGGSSNSGSSGSGSGSSSGSSSGSGSGSGTSILSAPSVTCTYGGSSTCGCSATQPLFASPTSRIYQGYTAVANSWPWVVAIFINNGQTFCGGFLVSYMHVVTAAHCVNGITASTITVYAGIQQLTSLNSGQSSSVSSVQVYSGYSSTTNAGDIAVLTLASPLTQTTTVGICCLTSDTSLPSVGEHGVIVGWGETSSTSGLSNNLLQAVIEVQSFSSCGVSTSSTGRFCAGYDGTSSCFGDSGGPFMTSVNNLWTCTGLVSAGVNCGGNTVYTQVSYYRSFIDGIVNGRK